MVIDLTPVRDGTGPARLPGMVEGGPEKAFKDWLAERDQGWRERVEVVATGRFHRVQVRRPPRSRPRPGRQVGHFHVVSLGAGKGRRVPSPDPAPDHGASGSQRRPALPGQAHPAHRGRPAHRRPGRAPRDLFADERHAAVQATWGVYQRLIQAYRAQDPGLGRFLMQRVIDSLKQTIPAGLEEIGALARTLTARAADILAYFDHPRTSNGPTEAVNGRLEHLRGIALGFRNLTHYTTRSLIHAGRLKDQLRRTT